VSDAVRSSELTTIIAKVEATGPTAYVTDLSLLGKSVSISGRYIQALGKH